MRYLQECFALESKPCGPGAGAADDDELAIRPDIGRHDVLGDLPGLCGPQRTGQRIHILSSLDNFLQAAGGVLFEQIFEFGDWHKNVMEFAFFPGPGDRGQGSDAPIL